MQTDTVGSFYSSMIICIHNDNLLIPRHFICIHDFKKRFSNLSKSITLSHPRGVGERTLDNFVSKKIHLLYVSSSQEAIWPHQSQKTHHLLLIRRRLRFVTIILLFCGEETIGN